MRALLSVLTLAAVLPMATAQQQPARESPPPDQARPDSGKRPEPSPRRDTTPFEDPLARQKLDDDLWITKGLQGGFKTDDLWILHPPQGSAPAAKDNDTLQPLGRGTFGAWPGSPASKDANRPPELTDEERARLVKEWENFVFGEPKSSSHRSVFGDPWSQPKTDGDGPSSSRPSDESTKPTIGSAPSDAPAEPSLQGDLTFGTQNPDVSLRPRMANPGQENPFSPFGPTSVPGLRPEGWLPNGSPSTSYPLTGGFPQTSQGLPGSTDPTFGTPNATPLSPFTPQMPGMNFGPPQNNFQFPGGPQGPTPTPRAHSTDSFMPRNPW